MINWVRRNLWGSPRRAVGTTLASVGILLWLTSTVPATADLARLLVTSSPIAWLAATFPNETRQVAGRLLGGLSAASKTVEREAAKLDIEGTLSSAADRLTAGWPSGAATELRLEYLRSDTDVERLANGTIVVGIASHENRTRNLVAAAWGWARHAVLRDARPFLHQDVSDGLDFVVARSLLYEVDPGAALDFLKTIWSPAVAGKDRLREVTDRLQRIQEHQLLGPIAVSEFMSVVARMGARFPNAALFDEVAAFVDYLYELAVREPGRDVGAELNFEGEIICCRVIFVARPEVYSAKGPTPYRKAVEWGLQRAYHSIYLLAADRNLPYLEEVIEPFRADPRIAEVTRFAGSYQTQSGRSREQVVARLLVDVKYRVGIGQRPLVAVGPERPVDLQRVRSRAEAG